MPANWCSEPSNGWTTRPSKLPEHNPRVREFPTRRIVIHTEPNIGSHRLSRPGLIAFHKDVVFLNYEGFPAASTPSVESGPLNGNLPRKEMANGKRNGSLRLVNTE